MIADRLRPMIWLRDPWRTRVLWLSLAGNLFAGALIAAHLTMHRRPGPPGLDGVVEHMAGALPDPDAARFRATLAHERPWYDLARRQMEESREQLSQAIAQQPYDETLVRERMHNWQTHWIETSNRFGDSLLSAIGELSPEGRTRLAEASLRPGHR
jgi:hypothetical protein